MNFSRFIHTLLADCGGRIVQIYIFEDLPHLRHFRFEHLTVRLGKWGGS